MADWSSPNYFTNPSLIQDPYEYLRAQGPVHREPDQGTYAVTGYDEVGAIYHDDRTLRLSEEHHGASGRRHFRFEPWFLSRRIEELRLEFAAIGS